MTNNEIRQCRRIRRIAKEAERTLFELFEDLSRSEVSWPNVEEQLSTINHQLRVVADLVKNTITELTSPPR